MDVPDVRLNSFLTWVRAFRDPDIAAIRAPPLLLPRDAVDLLGTILHKVYKNGMVKLFVGLHPLPDAAPAVLRALNNQPRMLAGLNRLIVLAFRDAKSAVPGRLEEVWALLPNPFSPEGVELPGDLRWVLPNAHIANAVRFMHSQQERVRTTLIPSEVSAAYGDYLSFWRGGVPDPATDWPAAMETTAVRAAGADTVFLARFVAVAGVAGEQMPKGRLDEFRRRWVGGDCELALKSVCAWASWMVARRVVEWMAEPLAGVPTADGTGDHGRPPSCSFPAHGMGGCSSPFASADVL